MGINLAGGDSMINKDKLEGMVVGSFLGDTLALGAHWIYDQGRIKQQFGEIEEPVEPLSDTYHVGKHLGDFTHYGDQTLFLFDYLSACQDFEINDFYRAFNQFFKHYGGYQDHATKDTLSNLSKNHLRGSQSNELGAVARLAPVIYLFCESRSQAVSIACAQTEATHQNLLVVDIAGVLANTVLDILKGKAPIAALEHHVSNGNEDIQKLYERGKTCKHMNYTDASLKLGQMCSAENAFPLVAYFLNQSPLDFKKIMRQNVMAGGDSAARGMVLGMILGAYLGASQLPKSWCEKMNAYDRILMRL